MITYTTGVHARDFGITILGQTDPADPPLGIHRLVLEALLSEFSRYLPIPPWVGEFDAIGENVLVGWDGSCEAARAVNDAGRCVALRPGQTVALAARVRRVRFVRAPSDSARTKRRRAPSRFPASPAPRTNARRGTILNGRREDHRHAAEGSIPRSGQNPKILGRDDTEVIRYLITIDTPFSGNLRAQEREDRRFEVSECRMTSIVGDMLVHQPP